MWRDALRAIVNWRRPFGLAMIGVLTIGSLDGFVRGLQQPLTRSRSVCVFTAQRP
jgi:hypothetical protein